MQRIIWVTRGCVGVLGALAVLLLWPVSPAQAAGGKSDPGGPDPTCAQILDGNPGWELAQETDPAAGSDVHGGQIIEVRMTWDSADFADAPLYHALDCVTVDGRLRTGLSLDEPNSPNDGEVTYRFEVPAGLTPGTEICSRGAIAGDGNGYFELNPSNDACFTVVEDLTPPDSPPDCASETPPAPPGACTSPPPATPPADCASETPPAPPGVCTSPPPATPPDTPADCALQTPPPGACTSPPPATPPDTPASVPPPVVLGATQEPALPLVAPVALDTLPRTGHPLRTLVLPAGLLLAIGGGGLIGAVRRPGRKR